MKDLLVLFIIVFSAVLSVSLAALRKGLTRTYSLHVPEKFLFNWVIVFSLLILICGTVAIFIP